MQSAVSVANDLPIPHLGDHKEPVRRAMKKILSAALERGSISVHEVALIIPAGFHHDRERFSQIVGWINAVLKEHKVNLVTDSQQQAHLREHPVSATLGVPVLRKKFRKEEPSPEDLKNSNAEVPIEFLESVSQYEFDHNAWYYGQIGKFRLLTIDEERELSRRIREEQDLDARNELVVHNLRLVRWIARRFSWSGIDFQDLLQWGNLGLITAAEKFDYRLGYKFSTYAIWWIRQTISKAIADYRLIVRLPVHIQQFQSKLRKLGEFMERELGRKPTKTELASKVGIPATKIERFELRTKIEVADLDSNLTSEEDSQTFGSTIPDEGVISPDMRVEAMEELHKAQTRINQTLETITARLDISQRDVEVFRAFYGFDGSGRRRTLQMVGEQFGLTRERIRQLLARTWKKVDDQGGEMDHDRLLEEQFKVEELKKFV